MQALAQETWRLQPDVVDVTIGELAYSGGMARTDPTPKPHHVWMDASTPIAWAWLWPPASLEWQVHPRHPDVFDSVLDWFEQNAESGPPELAVRAADRGAAVRVKSRGFQLDPTAPWM